MITERFVEEFVLTLFGDLGYTVDKGHSLSADIPDMVRRSYQEPFLYGPLTDAAKRLNPSASSQDLDEAMRRVTQLNTPSLILGNRDFHRMLVEGVEVEKQNAEGVFAGELVRLVDFDNPNNNEWLVANQLVVTEGRHRTRLDITVFVNGLPLAIFELKDPTDQRATIATAFQQLQRYQQSIPRMFYYNELLVISDGIEARIGSLTTSHERFMPWRRGLETTAPALSPLEALVTGVFTKQAFLAILKHFIVFQNEGGGNQVRKLVAGYHQYEAVNRAVQTTIAAQKPRGDGRCGVVWHTQGSGKSLTMVMFVGKIVMQPELDNPTVVVLTDRVDLDNQLFDTFAACEAYLRQRPEHAESKHELWELLRVPSGKIIFTTIHKFSPWEGAARNPVLSDRTNVVVIADEAHRSQYEFADGLAGALREALPNAAFLGFTGTPIEVSDRSTRAVFGEYVSKYDIQQAVLDGATVPIYYENRLITLQMNEPERPILDAEFDELTEGEEIERKSELKEKWSALEVIVGTQSRITTIARDLLKHFDQRLNAIDGKAIVVCMSRRICVQLYHAITEIRPEWHSDEDARGAIKVIMTGSQVDPVNWQPHIRDKLRRQVLSRRFRDSSDPFRVAIVRDMWLTGFDAGCLHTMYVDKPMRGHSLMQAIARVNRVFKNKPGGLIVDYIGLAVELRQALIDYTASGGQGDPTHSQVDAVESMLEYYEICNVLFRGFDWTDWTRGTPIDALRLLPKAQDHILSVPDGTQRLFDAVGKLSLAFAIAVPHAEAMQIRQDVTFFQAVRTALAKTTTTAEEGSRDHLEQAVRQILSRAIVTDQVIDIYSAVGLPPPDVSLLSDDFLREIQMLPQQRLAVEFLRKLLIDELRERSNRNLVQSRTFTEMLDSTIRAYHNRALETSQVVEELVGIAKLIRGANQRAVEVGVSEEELAIHDALTIIPGTLQLFSDDQLLGIARRLNSAIHQNATVDWTMKESGRARVRTAIRRTLRRHSFPSEWIDEITSAVFDQAEAIGGDWAV